MNKLKKKQMLELVRKLENVNYGIRKSKGKAAGLNLTEILAQCQESALILGNHLETLGEDFISLVEILETYCEEIYQLSLVLSQTDKCVIETEKVWKLLRELRDGIQSKVPEDKKEIVFLPYKVSMWDSLESVWKAAAEDERCDVYVIPIPYFEKKPDGTFGRMHYEGEEYSKYVTVTSWKTYNIKERKPDVIFIHNPYDDWNYVTSVHPNFYAKELREHTSCLVYIPYFAAVNNNMDRALCVLPGTLFANKIVVQSEEIKKIYIDELIKFEKENDCEGMLGDISGKILALGSPKYDRVFSVSKKQLKVPSHWNKVLYKEDGTPKKVVFYNTSIAPFLKNSEEMIVKIENVLRIFRKAQNEIALLWRPHPLMDETLCSLRPWLWQRYREIVRCYKEEGWGIYDETSDADSAFVLSDAYYGDGGSMFELFQKTGKPIMIQNVNEIRDYICL